MLNDLLIVVFLMFLNGVFSGAEIAVLSVRKTRLLELVDQGVSGARAVQWLRHQPERFLATVQIGITVVGTTAAAFGGEQLSGEFGKWLGERAPWMGPYATRLGLVSVVVFISFLEIVLGELVPKSLALRSAEGYALLMGRPLRLMSTLMKPFVWVLTGASNAILRIFGDKTSFGEARFSPEELQELVEEAARVGSMDAKASEIASRAIEFRDLSVTDVMVPRLRIVSLSQDASPEELLRLVRQRRVARLPVYDGNPENVIGYVALKDMVAPALDGQLSLKDILRPARFVPPTLSASTLLRDMQSQRIPLVMVVDESGGLLGLVTIEDLLEELVGDILSENERAPTKLKLSDDGTIELSGATPIREVNRELNLDLPEPDGLVTMAGLVLSVAHAIPDAGATFTLPDGTELEVLEASGRRVRKVLLRPRIEPPAPTSSASDES